MRTRASHRNVPTTGRYFSVDLAAALEQLADDRTRERAVESGLLRAQAETKRAEAEAEEHAPQVEGDADGQAASVGRARALRDDAEALERQAASLDANVVKWAEAMRARAAERRTALTALHACRVPGVADANGVMIAVQRRPATTADKGDEMALAHAKIGLYIGACWWGVTQDLEAARTEGEDRIAYGARVYEELVEAGYIGAEIRALGKVCGGRIGDAFIAESEVADRVGFSVPTTGYWT